MNTDFQNALLPAHRRRDPIRSGEQRLRIRVHARTKTSIPSTLVEGRVGPGDVECEIWESDLPKVKDKVETETQLVEQAKTIHERHRSEYIRKRYRGHVPENEADWDENLRTLAYSYTGSPEAEFQAIMSRGVKPLAEVVVLEHLEPVEDERTKQIREISASLANAAGNGGGGGVDPNLVQQIIDNNKALADKVDQLEAKLAGDEDTHRKRGRGRKGND